MGKKKGTSEFNCATKGVWKYGSLNCILWCAVHGLSIESIHTYKLSWLYKLKTVFREAKVFQVT